MIKDGHMIKDMFNPFNIQPLNCLNGSMSAELLDPFLTRQKDYLYSKY